MTAYIRTLSHTSTKCSGSRSTVGLDPIDLSFSQLRLHLRLLENWLHSCSLHDIPFHLQLTAHEKLLCVRLASNELSEIIVFQRERDYPSCWSAWEHS